MRKKQFWIVAVIMCLLLNLPIAVQAETSSGLGDGLNPGEVTQSKSAKWVDYQNGIAEITFDVIGKGSEKPIDVVMLIDNSTSMLAGNFLAGNNTSFIKTAEAAKKFIENTLNKNADTNIAIVPFSDYLFDQNRKKTVWDYYAVPMDENGRMMTHHILFLEYLKLDKNNRIIETDEKNISIIEDSNKNAEYAGLEKISFDDLKPLSEVKGSLVTPLSNDRSYLINTLNQLVPKGNTNYEKPIEKASSILLDAKDNGRKKYIIMLSDGEPNSYGGTGDSGGIYLDGIQKMNKLKEQFGNQLTVFSIGLNLSDQENETASEKLSALASLGADGRPLYYNIKSANLDEIYSTICGETQMAATNAIISDYINTEYFSYYSDETYKPTVNGVVAAEASFNEKAGKVIWNIGDITEELKTLKFYVKVKNNDGSTSNEGLLDDITNGTSLLNKAGLYETNTSADLIFTDKDGNAIVNGHEMASPVLPVNIGALKTTLFLSDMNGNYLDENGEITSKEHAAVLKTDKKENLVNGMTYDITPEQEIIINGITYMIYSEDTEKVSVNIEANTTKEVSFRYVIKPEHTVIFDANGGTISSDFHSQTVTYPKDRVDALATVQAPEGMNFVNWVDTNGNVFDLDTIVDRDLTVYAKYEWQEFTVTFQDEDGTAYKTETVKYGQSATAPIVNKDGMQFVGWDMDFTNVKKDIVVTAMFTNTEEPVFPIEPENPDVTTDPEQPPLPPIPTTPTVPNDTDNTVTITPIVPVIPTPATSFVQTPTQVVDNTTNIEEIEENETPLDNGQDKEVEDIKENETPLANGKANGNAWALINLLAMLGTIIASIVLVLSRHEKEEDDDEDDEKQAAMDEENEVIEKRRRWTKVLSIIIALVSVIFFILTEDIRLPMILVDRYTIYMLILLLTSVVTLIVGRNWKKQEDDKTQTINQEQ